MGKSNKHDRKSKKSKKYSSDSESDSGDDRSHKKSKSKDRDRKKDRRRSRSPIDHVQRKIQEVEEMKMKRKEQKELMKAYETPEEKRARRLAKKDAKERKRKIDMGWDQETLQYTNEDNPFGDHNLTDTFVWGAKLKREGRQVSEQEVIKTQRDRLEENKRELEKVKRRRLEREREREQLEAEREREQRDKESAYYTAWEKQEDNFHLEQAKERSRIRIEDGRAKAIDLLAKYINAKDDEMSVEMHEPYTYLQGLSIDDLEDLVEDIKVYLELEQGRNQDYWRDITILTKDQIQQIRNMDPKQYDRYKRDGIHQSVTHEVNSVFKNKTLNQLKILMKQIEKKLKGGEGIDITYWESLRQQLTAHIALTRLKEQHQLILKQRLAKLKAEQLDSESEDDFIKPDIPKLEKSELSESGEAGPSSKPDESEKTESSSKPEPNESDMKQEESEIPPDDELEEQEVDSDGEDIYDSARYSPPLLETVEEGTIIYTAIEDMKRLELQRLTLAKTGTITSTSDGDSSLVQRARQGMGEDEARFSVEFNLEQQSYLWSDKYRPRKPRFFNRVHTGFEWNKYNQTHYDMDNPPPKIVQGYKFNIFYPDLIDKTKTPEYSVIPIEDDKDFSILKFSAGPPYEEIAFKIVNREWEYSYKHGFKCQFQNDIFQLWFHFRRYRYRR